MKKSTKLYLLLVAFLVIEVLFVAVSVFVGDITMTAIGSAFAGSSLTLIALLAIEGAAGPRHDNPRGLPRMTPPAPKKLNSKSV